jgi:hypothetical protein
LILNLIRPLSASGGGLAAPRGRLLRERLEEAGNYENKVNSFLAYFIFMLQFNGF